MAQTSSIDLARAPPELLINIFDALESHRPTLAASIQVNRRWFYFGTDVLWRTAPCTALANVPEHRRQLYASKIISLPFYGDDESAYHSLFQNLQFGRLKRVMVDAHRPQDGDGAEGFPVLQYLQPSLEEFTFYGGQMDNHLLEHIQNTCFRLRCILIDGPGPGVTAASFLAFITRCTSLTYIEVMYSVEHLLTEELLLHLAERSTLSVLRLNTILSNHILHRISTDAVEPFKALRELDISVSASAVPVLVPMLKHITRLHLGVTGGNGSVHVLQHISRLADLRTLSLFFAAPTDLSPDDLLSLKVLSKLEELTIGPDERNDAAAVTALNPGFSDSDFDSLCSKLHSLRRIDFNVLCNLSVAAMVSLWRYHPLLEECTMPQIFDMQALGLINSRRAVFPELRLLEVGGFRPPRVFNYARSDR